MLAYSPGDPWSIQFITSSAAGAAVAADSTPTVAISVDGVDASGGWSLSAVSSLATGRYRITGTVPASLALGSLVEVIVSATIGGVAARAIVERFRVSRLAVDLVEVSGQPIASSVNPIAANLVQVNGVAVTGALPANMTQLAGTAVSGSIPANLVQMNGAAVSGALPANVTQLAGAAVSGSIPAHLTATGLDAIPINDPGGVSGMTTLPQLTVALWRRFYKKTTLASGAFTTYADDGTTVNTVQTTADNGIIQTVEAAQ